MTDPLSADEQRSILPRLAALDLARQATGKRVTGLLVARLVATVEAERTRAEAAEAVINTLSDKRVLAEARAEEAEADLADAHNVIRRFVHGWMPDAEPVGGGDVQPLVPRIRHRRHRHRWH